MRRTQILRLMIGMLAVTALTLVLGGGARGQVKFKTVHKFTGGSDGSSPSDALVFDAAGNLYGVSGGGVTGCYGSGCGTAYELSPNANGMWKHKVLHYFTPEEQFWPSGGLTFDSVGNLYGMTNQGADDGNVYELIPQPSGPWGYEVLYEMAGAYDGNPAGGLTFDASGNLYGTSAWGCGYGAGVSCVFEMTPSAESWTFNLLYGLTGSAGWYPSGTTPIFDAKGNIYATTAFGGDSGCSPYGNGCYGLGVVFELSPNGDGTWSETVLHTFTGGSDGESPVCALVFDTAGNLYGTTFAGGAFGYGNVFQLTPNAGGTWTEHVLHQFTGGKDGSTPAAGVTLDVSGNLYGTTWKGGSKGYGIVFKLTPTQTGFWDETVLHAFFNKGDGAYPWGAVVFDGAGNLYGTSVGDGTTTFGSVFEITP